MQMVGRQHHPDGLVGNLWRIHDPATINIGHCFLRGRLIKGDLFLCTEHSGDFFQTYVYVKQEWKQYLLQPEYSFGAYGIGDSSRVEVTAEDMHTLLDDGRVRHGLE